MFSVPLQNQFVAPLSALSSFRGAVHTGTNRKRQNTTTNPQLLCEDSLKEAIANCKELEHDLLQQITASGRRPLLSPDSLRPMNSCWIPERHISTSTFFENKHGMSYEKLMKPARSIDWMGDARVAKWRGLFKELFGSSSTGFLTSHRFFKTMRSDRVHGVSVGGDNIIGRFDSMVGINPTTIHSGTANPNVFGFRSKAAAAAKEAEKIKLEAEKSDRLKGILEDTHLTGEEQQRLKVAFAEGYLASNLKGVKPGVKMRLFGLIRDLLGIVLVIAILFSIMGGSFKVQLGNSNEVHPEEITETFDDVKGVDEAKQELKEIVEFLKNPDRFSALGGKLPKGVLLVGPPGTGKTLLARAVAGEAGVAFFHAAGPEFDEILVGQGARRVRDLFSAAKAKAPCVVFIDEIDSVGAKRTNSVLHPYANQTINQLLSEMDGFKQNEGVIVLGATNRREDLDRALLRPGRFDVEVTVNTPDFKGRKEILDLYLEKIKLAPDVDVDTLARGTTGFTGADIENLVNQAAVRAAIEDADYVTMKYLENARDKVLMGPERRSRIPDEEANTITAYHEGGHALVSYFTKDSHPLHKVTIVPRGISLGHTAYIPEKERYHVTKAQMMASMDTMMGGRAAEELIFGLEKITSGASSDLQAATDLATSMVKMWGMSEKVGLRTFDDNKSSLVVVNDLGQSTSELIDMEIKRMLSESYERAKAILKAHAKEHKALADALLKYETLDANDIKAILSGKEGVAVADWKKDML